MIVRSVGILSPGEMGSLFGKTLHMAGIDVGLREVRLPAAVAGSVVGYYHVTTERARAGQLSLIVGRQRPASDPVVGHREFLFRELD